jgi:hypothetical protein
MADEQQQSPAVLTGHTTEPAVVKDPVSGKTQAVHSTRVITDPESEEAVQIPDSPQADGRNADPLAQGPTPEEVFAGQAEPDAEVSGDDSDQSEDDDS